MVFGIAIRERLGARAVPLRQERLHAQHGRVGGESAARELRMVLIKPANRAGGIVRRERLLRVFERNDLTSEGVVLAGRVASR